MRKKRLLIPTTCILAATVGVYLTLQLFDSLQGNSFSARYARVRQGMTSDEVRAIMEGPWQGPAPQVVYFNGGVAHEWYGGGGDGTAHFDYTPDGKLVKKSRPGQDWEPDWLYAIRRQFGL
jgi:hypothetical protein